MSNIYDGNGSVSNGEDCSKNELTNNLKTVSIPILSNVSTSDKLFFLQLLTQHPQSIPLTALESIYKVRFILYLTF
jgi:hypothetical protein